MRKLLLGFFAIAFMSGATKSEQIQLRFRGPPGAVVALDSGESAAIDETGLAELLPQTLGPRRFVAYLDGHVPEAGLVVIDGTNQEILVGPFQPNGKVPAKNRGFGALWVETSPVEATVYARRLRWPDKVKKTRRVFVAPKLPGGRRKFTFCTDTKCFDHSFDLKPGAVHAIYVQFDPARIDDIGDDLASERQRGTKACLAGDARQCESACAIDLRLGSERDSRACKKLDTVTAQAP